MFKLLVFFVLSVLTAVANAEVGCDVGLYNKYVSGVGSLLSKNHEPVAQGGCTKSFTNGMYVNGWMSQSLRNPGLDDTYANELDYTFGWAGKLAGKWSAETHLAYFDFTNPRLLSGTNGDMTNAGGKLQYGATPTTSVYGLVGGYHGIGSLGFPGGWKAGFGTKSSMGPIAIDAVLIHNHNFFGRGEFVKVSLETVLPIAKVGNGELRPILMLWHPYGRYAKTHESQLMVGARMNW